MCEAVGNSCTLFCRVFVQHFALGGRYAKLQIVLTGCKLSILKYIFPTLFSNKMLSLQIFIIGPFALLFLSHEGAQE